MKTRIATALSVAGVLFAGSAAALVNTQVLSGHDAAESTSVLETPSSAPANSSAPVVVSVVSSAASTSTAASVPATSAAPASTVATTPAPVTSPATAPPSPVAYQVGEAGLVTVLAAGGTLTLVAAEPAPGWEVTAAESTSPTSVRVVLRSAAVEVQFDAALGADGSVVTAVDARSLEVPAGTAAPVPTSVDDRDDRRSSDRDDDDDDHDDDRDDRRGRDDDDDDRGRDDD